MESEKITYWMTLGVLALAAATGMVSGHQGWGDRLADRSINMISQASERARNYAEIASLVLGSGESDAVNTVQPEISVQNEFQNEIQGEVENHMACVQRVLVRHQAELARLQAMRVRVRMIKRTPRTIVWPARNMVIEIPQTF
jgi:glutamine amidotransferase PdxT